MLLDCVMARLVDMAPPDAAHANVGLSVAGACVSLRVFGRMDVIVMRVGSGPDSATVVRKVKTHEVGARLGLV